MQKLLKKMDFSNQDHVNARSLGSILFFIGRHLYISITNFIQALGYMCYLLVWLIYFALCLFGLGLVVYYLYLVLL